MILRNTLCTLTAAVALSGCATMLKPEVREVNGGVFARACSDTGDVSTKRDLSEYEAKVMIANYLTGGDGQVDISGTMTRFKRQGDEICAEVYLKR